MSRPFEPQTSTSPTAERPPIDVVLDPLKQTLSDHALVGASLLVVATLVALALANSPWADSYHTLWETKVSIGGGGLVLEKDLVHWVNDALMAVFFFHVGLEIKLEVLAGQLSSWRKIALPLAAAVGGMVVPPLLYLAFTQGTPLVHGWGMTMATDIAFALGVFAVLGDRVPSGLKVFITALAIVDDVGSVLVIALFYSEGIAPELLGLAAVLLITSVSLNRLGVRSWTPYAALGVLVWLCFLKSGVHATLAAVLMATTIPARTQLDAGAFANRVQAHLATWRATPDPDDALLSDEQQRVADALAEAVERGTAPAQRFMEALGPLVGTIVLPIFALANAGVALHPEQLAEAPVQLIAGVVVGLALGKPIGVVGAALLAVKAGVADLPPRVDRVHLLGTGLVAGIGFTMSLFISGLAFDTHLLQEASKLAVLLASLAAAAIGATVLALWSHRRTAVE